MAVQAAYLVLKNIPQSVWSYQIEDHPKLLGRSTNAHVVIPSRFVRASRRHAEVWCDKLRNWIRDLESRAGTCVNGVWIDQVPEAEIVVGDNLWIGGAEIAVVGQVCELG